MCVSCGCDSANDQHGDQRHITMNDLDQAAQAAGTTREQVVQNIAQAAGRASSDQRGDFYSSDVARTSGRQPGEYAPQAGQDSGSAWQESQQMGQTWRGTEDNPLSNP